VNRNVLVVQCEDKGFGGFTENSCDVQTLASLFTYWTCELYCWKKVQRT